MVLLSCMGRELKELRWNVLKNLEEMKVINNSVELVCSLKDLLTYFRESRFDIEGQNSRNPLSMKPVHNTINHLPAIQEFPSLCLLYDENFTLQEFFSN